MAMDEKIIYVYDNFSEDVPCLIGRLYIGVIKGGETYSFEYDADWLVRNKMKVSLDPQLQPFTGRQFPTGKNIFGIFADASPDRWGRVLMNKRERMSPTMGLSRHMAQILRLICWNYGKELYSIWLLPIRMIILEIMLLYLVKMAGSCHLCMM